VPGLRTRTRAFLRALGAFSRPPEARALDCRGSAVRFASSLAASSVRVTPGPD
jgi:hypothetical protein